MAKKDTPLYIGIDLGGTNIGAGVVTPDGEVLGYERTKTKAEQGADAVLERIVKTAEKACDETGVEMKSIRALGVGAPGTCDLEQGIIKFAANLRWKDFPRGPDLPHKLGIPIVVDNDVNVGAWGEYRAGAAKGYKFKDMLAVFVGTGIGAGLVFKGELFHGHYLTAGEIGQTVMFANEVRGRNTLENTAGRNSMVNQLKRLVEQNGESSLADDLLDPDARIGSKKIKAAYEAGDALTVEVLENAAHCIGVAVANQVTMLSLPLVVLGGGVSEALGKDFLKLVRKSFERVVHPPYMQQCEIVLSTLEDHAGIVGAALLAADRAAST